MKRVDNLKKKVQANLKAATGKKKLAFTFTKEHFKKKLSNPNGVGMTDLKPSIFALYVWLLKKYGAAVQMDFKGSSVEDVEISLYVKA